MKMKSKTKKLYYQSTSSKVATMMRTVLHVICVAAPAIFTFAADSSTSIDNDATSSYGIDVSMPIFKRISTNYPWLPHNTNTSAPKPRQYENMPIQPLGNRQAFYNNHLSKCREHYKRIKLTEKGHSSSNIAGGNCDIYEYDRLLMNQRQPRSMQNYTEVGFHKTRAPDDVMELATKFWDDNHLNMVRENWPIGNTYLNSWDAPTYMVPIEDPRLRGGGSQLKKKLWDAARDSIEEWTGEDLSPTSIYGIRVYKEGAVLLPHVDRLPLVASAMVNIAQDVDEDWPLEIYDHKGIAHNVTLTPGDMLLFESHSTIHGRPFPLKGRFYAMLFIHFEPTGHSLRHNVEHSINVEKQYKEAAREKQGGQSATATLPPYILRESPEEIHWRQLNPEGWTKPEFNPLKRSSSSKLHKAAAAGDINTIERVLTKDDQREKIPGRARVVDKRDEEGWQLMHSASASGHTEVVELLVQHGADLNSRTHGGHGATPLYIAERNNGGFHPVVRYLKSLGALSLGPEL
jgi:prolyl 4-hydroxylase